MVASKDEIRRERAPVPDPIAEAPPEQRLVIPAKRNDESVRDYIIRPRAEDAARGELAGDPAVLSPELEERIAAARGDGGVMIEWRRPGRCLEFHVKPSGSLGHLLDETGEQPAPMTEANEATWTEVERLLTRPSDS